MRYGNNANNYPNQMRKKGRNLGQNRSGYSAGAITSSEFCPATFSNKAQTTCPIYSSTNVTKNKFSFRTFINSMSSENTFSSLATISTTIVPVNFGDDEYGIDEYGPSATRKKRVNSCPDLSDLNEGASNIESIRLDLADHGNIHNSALCSSKGVPSMTHVVSFPCLKSLLDVKVDECEKPNVACENRNQSSGKKDPTAFECNHDIIAEVSQSDLIQGKIDPSTFLKLCLQAKGIDAHAVSSIQLFEQGVFRTPTAEQISAYDHDVLGAVRAEDISKLECMFKSGRTLQCSNRFGESILHTACRCGLTSVVSYLVEEALVSIKVADDFGRTPMHDACWAHRPSIELTEILLKTEPGLLLVTDKRGNTPLQYSRPELWGFWCKFLDERKHMLLPLDLSN